MYINKNINIRIHEASDWKIILPTIINVILAILFQYEYEYSI